MCVLVVLVDVGLVPQSQYFHGLFVDSESDGSSRRHADCVDHYASKESTDTFKAVIASLKVPIIDKRPTAKSGQCSPTCFCTACCR